MLKMAFAPYKTVFFYRNCIMKNCLNDKAFLYGYIFGYEISEVPNEVTRTVMEVVSYYRKTNFCSPKNVVIF